MVLSIHLLKGLLLLSQEIRSSRIWKPDPVRQVNVQVTNGRPNWENVLKDIQVVLPQVSLTFDMQHYNPYVH